MSPAASLAERLALYAITPTGRPTPASLAADAEIALRAGVTTLQLRDKSDRPADERLAIAIALRDLCRHHGALFIVNDDIDLCLDADADGIHLGPHDAPVTRAREALGTARIIGASAGTPERASALRDAGADYIGVGAIYAAQASKPDASPPRGVEAIRAVREAIGTHPLVAIGGITPDRTGACIAAGADGVASIRELLGADDIRSAVLQFREALGR